MAGSAVSSRQSERRAHRNLLLQRLPVEATALEDEVARAIASFDLYRIICPPLDCAPVVEPEANGGLMPWAQRVDRLVGIGEDLAWLGLAAVDEDRAFLEPHRAEDALPPPRLLCLNLLRELADVQDLPDPSGLLDGLHWGRKFADYICPSESVLGQPSDALAGKRR